MSKEKLETTPEKKEKGEEDLASMEGSAWEDESDLEKADELGRPKKKLPPKRFGEWPKAA